MKVYTNVIDAQGLQENERKAIEARTKKHRSDAKADKVQVENDKAKVPRKTQKRAKAKAKA